MAFIEIKNLLKKYQMGATEITALRDVSLSMERGEFVLVMGASGSGKSTLLNLAGGIDKPTRGEVIIDTQNFSTLNDDQLTHFRRRHIGFIFQFFNLLPTLTALENVALPELIRGTSLARCRERAEAALGTVNLKHRTHHKPAQLSAGEQQRVAIARAMLNNPSIILADEPTGNLDSKTSEEILSILRRTRDENGQTILMVSHNPFSMKFCDRILFLKDGAISGEEITEGKTIDESFLTSCLKKYLG